MNPGLLLAFVLLLAGGGCYFWAPKMGPNHWFGMRFSYAMADREVWNKTNRWGGLLFLLAGLLIGLLALCLPRELDSFLTLAAVAMVLGIVLLSYRYAKALGDVEQLEIAPELIAWRKRYLVFVSALILLLLGCGLLWYRFLPAEVAVHFTSDGAPDDFMPRALAVFVPVVLQFGLLSFFLFVYQDRMRISARIALLTLGVFFSVHFVITFVALDILFYGVKMQHLFDFNWFTFLLPVFVLFPPLFFWWWQRKQEKRGR